MTQHALQFIAFALLILPACTERAHEPGAPTSETFASTRQIMLLVTQPTSNVVFAAQGEAPADEPGWADAETNALVLAESGVLLTLGARRVDGQEWSTFARALAKSANAAATAARARNAGQFAVAADEVYATCEGCHLKYLKK